MGWHANTASLWFIVKKFHFCWLRQHLGCRSVRLGLFRSRHHQKMQSSKIHMWNFHFYSIQSLLFLGQERPTTSAIISNRFRFLKPIIKWITLVSIMHRNDYVRLSFILSSSFPLFAFPFLHFLSLFFVSVIIWPLPLFTCLCVVLLLLFIAHNKNSSSIDWFLLSLAFATSIISIGCHSIDLNIIGKATHTAQRNNLGPNLSRTLTIDSYTSASYL